MEAISSQLASIREGDGEIQSQIVKLEGEVKINFAAQNLAMAVS